MDEEVEPESDDSQPTKSRPSVSKPSSPVLLSTLEKTLTMGEKNEKYIIYTVYIYIQYTYIYIIPIKEGRISC